MDHPDAGLGDARRLYSLVQRLGVARRLGGVVGTAMAVVMHFTPTYPLALGGFTFPGYTALYTVIVNLALAIALTPMFNAMSGGRTSVD